MAINPLSLIGPTGTGGAQKSAAEASGASFSEVLKSTVGNAVESQMQAAELTRAAAEGRDVPMHEIVQAVSQAELALQTLVTVRDRAIEAYQQIQQMPI